MGFARPVAPRARSGGSLDTRTSVKNIFKAWRMIYSEQCRRPRKANLTNLEPCKSRQIHLPEPVRKLGPRGPLGGGGKANIPNRSNTPVDAE